MYRISFAYRVQINLICRGNHYEFLSLAQELAAPGEMRQAQSFDFNFKNVEKQYESYSGINVKLRSVKLCLLWLTWAKLIYRVSYHQLFPALYYTPENGGYTGRTGYLGA
jgi:hypothetical protein